MRNIKDILTKPEKVEEVAEPDPEEETEEGNDQFKILEDLYDLRRRIRRLEELKLMIKNRRYVEKDQFGNIRTEWTIKNEADLLWQELQLLRQRIIDAGFPEKELKNMEKECLKTWEFNL